MISHSGAEESFEISVIVKSQRPSEIAPFSPTLPLVPVVDAITSFHAGNRRYRVLMLPDRQRHRIEGHGRRKANLKPLAAG